VTRRDTQDGNTQQFVNVIDGTLEKMLHATENTLTKYPELLASVRNIEGLNETRPGVFYRKSKAFLHFHEDPSGLYADLRVNVNEEFVRTRVETRVEQSAFIATITSALTPPERK
jgi:hypothetical protein